MEQLELIEKQEIRNQYIDRIDVLDKVKEVILLPYGDSMTMEMVSDYYEVGLEAINSLVKDNREEIESDGYEVLVKDELKSFKNLCEIKSRARQISIFTKRSILRVGMLLRDSEIAKQVRTSLLNMSENKNAIQQEINNIDKEKLLMLDIMCAKDDMERMVSMNNLKRYKDEQQEKIELEKKSIYGES